VAVGVDEARDHDGVARVDHVGLRRRFHLLADGGDLLAVDEHVALCEVADAGSMLTIVPPLSTIGRRVAGALAPDALQRPAIFRGGARSGRRASLAEEGEPRQKSRRL
jgi:hypothetical protein